MYLKKENRMLAKHLNADLKLLQLKIYRVN